MSHGCTGQAGDPRAIVAGCRNRSNIRRRVGDRTHHQESWRGVHCVRDPCVQALLPRHPRVAARFLVLAHLLSGPDERSHDRRAVGVTALRVRVRARPVRRADRRDPRRSPRSQAGDPRRLLRHDAHCGGTGGHRRHRQRDACPSAGHRARCRHHHGHHGACHAGGHGQRRAGPPVGQCDLVAVPRRQPEPHRRSGAGRTDHRRGALRGLVGCVLRRLGHRADADVRRRSLQPGARPLEGGLP